MPQRMSPSTSALMELAALYDLKDRLLHPPPDRHEGHFDQSALSDDLDIGGGYYTLYFDGPSPPG